MTRAEWTLFHARFHQTLRKRQLLPKRQRSLVAVSGGQDSLCLMRLLLDLQPKWAWELAIAHCNHHWRSDADANAAYVRQLAQTWELPYHEAIATEDLTSEAAAREWRYQQLTAIALEHGYTHIVTGHTASDRAETLLYNLIRGSGTDGLQALAWQRKLAPGVVLVRPLLEVTRAETASFCQAANLTVWEDSTNQDWRYARNRIRQELIPYLQTHFNPQVEQTLNQTADLLQAEAEFLQTSAAELYQQCAGVSPEGRNKGRNSGDRQNGEGSAAPLLPDRLDLSILKAAPLALQRRTIRQFLQAILPVAPNFEQIDKLVALINAPNRSQTDPFPGGVIAQVEGKWIVIKMMG